MDLPIEFCERMRKLIKDDKEFTDFLHSYDSEPVRAIRINPDKASASVLEMGISVEKIPHIENGYYFACDKIGSTPIHHAGGIYVQDPSAMAVVECVDIEPDFKILDMCASPGGKSTQAASKLSDEGLIVSNEIIPPRAQILLQNIERMGLRNSVVTSCNTSVFAECSPEYFDLVIVDAPCSGEGMMRKNPLAVSEWSVENVLMCAERQQEILENAYKATKCGGYILYSTCTFSIEENEERVEALLKAHADLTLMPIKKEICDVTSDGIAISSSTGADLRLCRRFYPHISNGEGQFAALIKKGGEQRSIKYKKRTEKPTKQMPAEREIVMRFIHECLASEIPDGERVVARADGFYILPKTEFGLVNEFSCGVKVGSVQKGRVVPHHRFFSAYGKFFKNQVEIGSAERASKYMRGETLEVNCNDGWGVFTVCGAAMGGFKAVGGVAKNHYPKGLRIQG